MTLVFAVSFATASAMAGDYLVRHDRKLEQMIMAAAAQKVGHIRGSLEGEWRAPSALSTVADLSALDMIHYAQRARLQEAELATGAIKAPRPVAQPPMLTITSSSGVRRIMASGG